MDPGRYEYQGKEIKFCLARPIAATYLFSTIEELQTPHSRCAFLHLSNPLLLNGSKGTTDYSLFMATDSAKIEQYINAGYDSVILLNASNVKQEAAAIMAIPFNETQIEEIRGKLFDKIGLTFKRVIELEGITSASSIESFMGQLFIIGDDASKVLITDRELARPAKYIDLFRRGEGRIPKQEKADMEGSLVMWKDDEPYLIILGSASTPVREQIVVMSITKPTQFKMVNSNEFVGRIKKAGISDVNIEAATTIGIKAVLGNRGNQANRKNQIIITDTDFWEKQGTAPIRISEIIREGEQGDDFIGISGFSYIPARDILMFTGTKELTSNSYDDGRIGDSYIGWITEISKKLDQPQIAIEHLTNLSENNMHFQGQKMEGICVQEQNLQGTGFVINMVADNDDGTSRLFEAELVVPVPKSGTTASDIDTLEKGGSINYEEQVMIGEDVSISNRYNRPAIMEVLRLLRPGKKYKGSYKSTPNAMVFPVTIKREEDNYYVYSAAQNLKSTAWGIANLIKQGKLILQAETAPVIIISAKKKTMGQGYKAFKSLRTKSTEYEVKFSDGTKFTTYRASDADAAKQEARIWWKNNIGKNFTYKLRKLLQLLTVEKSVPISSEHLLSKARFKYQWKANREGGQKYGNKQIIVPTDEHIYEKYLRQLMEQDMDFSSNQKMYGRSYCSFVSKDNSGEWILWKERPAVSELIPPSQSFDKGWVIEVADFNSPPAIAQGISFDSDTTRVNQSQGINA